MPLFLGEWSSTREYEALVSVQHNGFTYLSKKPVPKNVEITNEDFWLRWADPNAQMEQLYQEYVALDSAVQTWDETLDELIDDINTPPIWVVIGDSYSDPTLPGYVQNNVTPWPNLISQSKNVTIKNYAKAGAGYVHASGTPFPTQAVNASNDTSYDHSKVERVIIYGGINDSSSSENIDTVYSNAISTFNTLKTAFPNADICAYFSWYPYVLSLPMQAYAARVMLAATASHVGFSFKAMTLLMNFKVTDAYLSDNIHPNQLGHNVISSFFASDNSDNMRIGGALTIGGAQSIGNFRPNGQYSAGESITVTRSGSTTFTYNDSFDFDVAISDMQFTVNGITSGDTKPIIVACDLDDAIFRYFSDNRHFPMSAVVGLSNAYVSITSAYMLGQTIFIFIRPLTGAWNITSVTVTLDLLGHGKIY